MRLARYEFEGGQRSGVVEGEQLQPLPPSTDIVSLLTRSGEQREAALLAARELTPPLPLTDVRLLAPLRPATIRDFVSFEAHAEGVGKLYNPDGPVNPEWYEAPFFHFQNAHAIFGPDDDVEVPPGCKRFDFELEVAAVIGRWGETDVMRPVTAPGIPFSTTVRLGIWRNASCEWGSAWPRPRTSEAPWGRGW